MGIESFIKKLLGQDGQENLVSVDIGTSSIKMLELNMSSNPPKLLSAGVAAAPAGAVKNHTVVNIDEVAKVIRTLVQANGFVSTRAITSIPGPSVFTKKATVGFSDIREFESNLSFEASNYIPHNINDVRLDYQVLKKNGSTSMDVLLVAVKNDIVSSYVQTLSDAGVEPVIADVDYFALGNMFELNYPEEKEKTVALIDVGARYTSINIIVEGESVFTGDVAVGGRLYTDAICESLGLKAADAEKAKMGLEVEGIDPHVIAETMDQTTEHITSELQRQLGFFWSAAATDKQIDTIYVCGGSSQTRGFLEELSAKTGIACHSINPFRGLDCSGGIDEDYLNEIAPSMAVSVGLAMRRLGDKVHATS